MRRSPDSAGRYKRTGRFRPRDIRGWAAEADDRWQWPHQSIPDQRHRESRGTISGKLQKEHPLLERPEIAEDIVRAIREEFPWTSAGDSTTKVPEQS